MVTTIAEALAFLDAVQSLEMFEIGDPRAADRLGYEISIKSGLTFGLDAQHFVLARRDDKVAGEHAA